MGIPHVNEIGILAGPCPRHFVLRMKETLSSLSPFALHKGVRRFAGDNVAIKRQPNLSNCKVARSKARRAYRENKSY